MPWTHTPIMAPEIADFLLTRPNGVYIDGTLGLGGHTRFFLSRLGPSARIFGFDKDENALQMAKQNVADARLQTFHNSYLAAADALKENHINGADGALFDLGLSSYQLDDPSRGFSLLRDGPLDMRFDPSCGTSAADIVNTWPLQDLTRILTDYGEEPRAEAIARSLLDARRQAPITTTLQLKQLVENVYHGRRGKTHPATQTFQALRIACNQELEAVSQLLLGLDALLNTGARAAFLTFHSLEDRLVKNQFKTLAQSGRWKILTKHPLVPSRAEILQNHRARSAKLRVIEKIL